LEVPYWWQFDKESIITIIHQERPDIVPQSPGTPFQYHARISPIKELNVTKYLETSV